MRKRLASWRLCFKAGAEWAYAVVNVGLFWFALVSLSGFTVTSLMRDWPMVAVFLVAGAICSWLFAEGAYRRLERVNLDLEERDKHISELTNIRPILLGNTIQHNTITDFHQAIDARVVGHIPGPDEFSANHPMKTILGGREPRDPTNQTP